MSLIKDGLFFEESGRGIPLVCLHGFPLDHTIWLPLMREMRQGARLILPDLRGHGRSPAPQGTYTMRSMAEDVVRLLDRLEVERAVVAGHSMGGYVALAFARHFPDRLLGLALVASHVYADPEAKRKDRLQTAQEVLQSGVEGLTHMADHMTRQPALREELRQMIRKAPPQGVAGVLRGMAERQDEMALWSSLGQSAMLIAGAEDQVVSLERSRTMGRALPAGQYVEIAGAGHMPMLEACEETAAGLRGLLGLIKEKI